jgi:hypothetical protein
MEPRQDAKTLADTLEYAERADTDPARVFQELAEVVLPYCQTRATLKMLRALFRNAAEVPRSPPRPPLVLVPRR